MVKRAMTTNVFLYCGPVTVTVTEDWSARLDSIFGVCKWLNKVTLMGNTHRPNKTQQYKQKQTPKQPNESTNGHKWLTFSSYRF